MPFNRFRRSGNVTGKQRWSLRKSHQIPEFPMVKVFYSTSHFFLLACQNMGIGIKGDDHASVDQQFRDRLRVDSCG